VSAASRKGRFAVGRDGRLHDLKHLQTECRLSEGDASVPLASLAEVAELSRLLKVKACAFCAESVELQQYWRSRSDQGD
jgi:hypothetical protein